MGYKIGNFTDFLNEGEYTEEFKATLFKALKDANLVYSVESSPAQLKNGTIVIRIHDLDVLKKALVDRGITDDDITNQASLKSLYDQWEHPQINKRTERDTGLAKYTIYSRGGIRLLSASSDAYKFDPKTEAGIKGAVDWLINHYSVWFIQVATSNVIKSDKFTTYKKGYDLDLSKVSQYINPVTLQFLERIKSDSQKKFEELAPSIMILCYLAHEKETVVHASSGTNLERMQFDVTNDDIEEKIEFFVNQDWSVGIKNPTVRMTIKKSWYYIKHYSKSGGGWIRQESASATLLASKSNFPDYQQTIIAKLLKAPDYDFEALDAKFSGAKSGQGYGI
jgi:hypothetical protein